MIKNYQGVEFKSKGIDLTTYNKQELIDRFSKIKVTGVNVLLLVYTGVISDKTTGGLLLPDDYNDKHSVAYHSYTGLILQIGSDALEPSYWPTGSQFNVGDWAIIPRASCLQVKYEDEHLIMTEAFKIKAIVDDPSKVAFKI